MRAPRLPRCGASSSTCWAASAPRRRNSRTGLGAQTGALQTGLYRSSHVFEDRAYVVWNVRGDRGLVGPFGWARVTNRIRAPSWLRKAHRRRQRPCISSIFGIALSLPLSLSLCVFFACPRMLVSTLRRVSLPSRLWQLCETASAVFFYIARRAEAS